jgi:type I restriction enzyme, S subunit
VTHTWPKFRLKFAVDKIGSGKTPLGGAATHVSSGIMLLRSQNIHFNGLRLEEVVFIDEDTDAQMASTRVQPDDVLLNITGASLGRCTIAPKDISPANVNQHVCILRPNQKYVEPRFLNMALQSAPVQRAIFAGENGSSREGLTFEQVGNFEIALPPLPDQQAIADYLDRETARLDGLVAAKERVLRLLAEKRRALITHAVTRGLDPHAPMKDTGVEWLPRVPRHWIPTKISRLFRQAKRLGFADLTVLSVYRDYGVIERATRDDNANRVPDDLEKYQLVEPGDLVINKMKAWQGSLGISELNGITSPDYVVFCPLHCEAPPFLHYLLRNQLLTTVYLSMSNGIRTSQWRLEPDRFGTLVLFLPPLVEQHAIVAHITTETAKLDALRSATERTIALLKERRAALIAAAVTGKLDGQGVERHIAVVAN